MEKYLTQTISQTPHKMRTLKRSSSAVEVEDVQDLPRKSQKSIKSEEDGSAGVASIHNVPVKIEEGGSSRIQELVAQNGDLNTQIEELHGFIMKGNLIHSNSPELRAVMDCQLMSPRSTRCS